MNVRDLEKKHIGQRATVTFPESESKDSFTGVLTSLTHAEAPEGWAESVASHGVFKINGRITTSVGSMTESSAEPATITFLTD